MINYSELEKNIKSIIDDLKGLCAQNGLSNTASEEIVVTSVFLYKFLNDKFIYNLKSFAKELSITYEELISSTDYMDAFYNSHPQDVSFAYEDTIDYLVGFINDNDFFKKFDEALVRISNYDKNFDFCIDTAEGTKKLLFIPLSNYIEPSKRNPFAKSIFSYITRDRFDFDNAFQENYDFFSTIFEYLISDYNKDSGKYAEYFTPQALSKAISQILVRMSPIEDKLYEIYDPSAGSGSLILHLANELGEGKFGNKARVYTQDISQKSSRFLRINMLLNGLKESLENIVEGDTLLTPAHFKIKNESSSGLKKFDYITSNPPFKTDFSSTRDQIESSWSSTDRFFAGIPSIPNKKKESMAIYLLFIQHILYSLKDNGKAAIVVPTGFITAQSKIEQNIRKKIVDNHWLKGVISMPSNIFANTGTNVSVLFVDKSNSSDKVLLMDASKMGHKENIKNIQKTVLTSEELEKIVDTFVSQNVVDDFTVLVSDDEIKEKNYSFSAGQYFEVKIEYIDITQEEYEKMIDDFNNDFAKYVEETTEFQKEISKVLKELKINE